MSGGDWIALGTLVLTMFAIIYVTERGWLRSWRRRRGELTRVWSTAWMPGRPVDFWSRLLPKGSKCLSYQCDFLRIWRSRIQMDGEAVFSGLATFSPHLCYEEHEWDGERWGLTWRKPAAES